MSEQMSRDDDMPSILIMTMDPGEYTHGKRDKCSKYDNDGTDR